MENVAKSLMDTLKLTLLIAINLILGLCKIKAQLPEYLYQTQTKNDSIYINQLHLSIDNLNFFRNNESITILTPGYTLPGFKFQSKLIYFPTANVQLHAGVHLLWLWGANQYPTGTYGYLPGLEDNTMTQPVHILPLLTAQATLADHLQIILGNIYGAANHQLTEPLFHPDRNLVADPETGLQILYNIPNFSLDTWINWTKFIYFGEQNQEKFVYGLSSKWKVNPRSTTAKLTIPLQLIAAHKGGQIDNTNLGIETLTNVAAGISLAWNFPNSKLNNALVESYLLGYKQLAGEAQPLQSGMGSYTAISAHLDRVYAKMAYWYCKDFISILGNPLFGATSTSTDGTFTNPKMITIGLAYTHNLAHGYTLGIDADVFFRFSDSLNLMNREATPVNAKINYFYGVFLRANPSFLLKVFNK